MLKLCHETGRKAEITGKELLYGELPVAFFHDVCKLGHNFPFLKIIYLLKKFSLNLVPEIGIVESYKVYLACGKFHGY